MDASATSASPANVIETPLASLHRENRAKMGVWFGCALPDDFGSVANEYKFLRESVALLDKNYRAYLSFAGPDRVRYLNAILTNNIKDLKRGEGTVSLFLNPQGHIQAEIETYADAERLFCISFAMIRERLVPALDHYIIMDDVALTDETEEFGTLALEGPKTASVAKEVTAVDLEALPELAWAEARIGTIPVRVVRRSPGGVAGAEFVAERAHLAELWKALESAVTKQGGGACGYSALNALRFEQGIPWFGYDFGEKQIPHEAGLQDSHISYTKGCYTGQEIVERVRSRGAVNRRRVLFSIATQSPPRAGTNVLLDGKEIGFITRSALSPNLGNAIAFGYVRKEATSDGANLSCDGAATKIIPPPLAG